jgi:hypothetical protein
MIRIDLGFLLLGAICLVTGVTLGIAMGIAHDFQFAPLHAHINLVGWASLSLFGLIYRAYPTLARSWLGTAHFFIAALAAPVFLVGLYFALAHQVIIGAVVGSLIWLCGCVLFLINLGRLAFTGATQRAASEALGLRSAA